MVPDDMAKKHVTELNIPEFHGLNTSRFYTSSPQTVV